MVQQVKQEADAKIAELTKKLDEATAMVKSKQEELRLKQEKADDERHALAVKLLQDSGLVAAQTEKVHAETDLIQVQTITETRNAAIIPSPEMLKEAQTLEEKEDGTGQEDGGADAATVSSGANMVNSESGVEQTAEPVGEQLGNTEQ